jgi:hypothetical protein
MVSGLQRVPFSHAERSPRGSLLLLFLARFTPGIASYSGERVPCRLVVDYVQYLGRSKYKKRFQKLSLRLHIDLPVSFTSFRF